MLFDAISLLGGRSRCIWQSLQGAEYKKRANLCIEEAIKEADH